MTQKENALLQQLHSEIRQIKLSQESLLKEILGDPTYFREGLMQRQLHDEDFQKSVTADLNQIMTKTDKLVERNENHHQRLKKIEDMLRIFNSISAIRKGTAWLIIATLTFLTTLLALWDDIKTLIQR